MIACIALLYVPFRHGLPGFIEEMQTRHTFAIRTVTPDGAVDDSFLFVGFSPYQSHILFFYRAIAELINQRVKSRHCFSHDHDARSILIQSMNDSRPALTADSFQVRTMM